MKPLFAKVLVLMLMLGVGPPLANAYVETYGDFVVIDDVMDAGVTLFDSVTNPSPFPVSATIQQAATYPATGTGDITVGEIQTYLATQGFDTSTFGLAVVLGPEGTVGFASMVITIGGDVAAISDGLFTIVSFESQNVTTGFLPELYLDLYESTDEVLISYNTFTSTDDVVRIDLIGTPEPVSLLFLGTGLAATILVRLRRKKK